ncbi:dienelactone hydrolase family protein [Phenylobacterium sp.]|jgi:carboxymethylenebutenolidase|uniref:dienelactone hydrolase family protein n=1 Tax=Phenylobacterium sp. TaxID=1871053 RepID=UPI000C8D1647|nr:dienelactone hydrolase family protein [Phenylobacterium sp.]MAK82692.1 dienelactone hydrolase [Phenylobacterium sp.]|tara:strand:- start:38489 stop:39181 length:693 start_codon:yes stop_codon:yes gene_type:complete
MSRAGETIRLESRADGFAFDAYHVKPGDARRGGLVLIQEIFGVTDHIREVADDFAEDGYEVIAPAFFDRQQRGFEASYDPDDMARAAALSQAALWDQVTGDAQAAIDALQGPVFAAGFCWGGAASWAVAARCEGVAAASCFYGRRISELLDEPPRCPTILHFGKIDASIPLERVEEIRDRYPDMPVHMYDAGHGFASDRRKDYQPDAAHLARLRTLQLFARSGGGRGEGA